MCTPREIWCEFCKFGWSPLILELVELLSWRNLIQNITWEVIYAFLESIDPFKPNSLLSLSLITQLIYSYTRLKKREDIWEEKKKKKKKKVVQSSIYSNVLSCLVTRGIHYQCLLLRQTVTWNMSMQKHFKFVTCWVTGCIHHKCLHSRQKISDDLEKKNWWREVFWDIQRAEKNYILEVRVLYLLKTLSFLYRPSP